MIVSFISEMAAVDELIPGGFKKRYLLGGKINIEFVQGKAEFGLEGSVRQLCNNGFELLRVDANSLRSKSVGYSFSELLI